MQRELPLRSGLHAGPRHLALQYRHHNRGPTGVTPLIRFVPPMVCFHSRTALLTPNPWGAPQHTTHVQYIARAFRSTPHAIKRGRSQFSRRSAWCFMAMCKPPNLSVLLRRHIWCERSGGAAIVGVHPLGGGCKHGALRDVLKQAHPKRPDRPPMSNEATQTGTKWVRLTASHLCSRWTTSTCNRCVTATKLTLQSYHECSPHLRQQCLQPTYEQ